MHEIYPWQKSQWEYLLQRKINNRFPHGLLISGLPGLGKSEFALALAELLLCKQINQQQACTTCRSCKFIQAGSHPDFHLIQPETEANAIKIDQMRNIIEITNQKSHQGRYQTVIIDPADAMNISAGNAILKTLEEPQGQVAMILVTDKPSFLPATIRSRCQHIAIDTPSWAIAKQWLQQKIPDATNIDLLLTLAENAPLKALAFAQGENMQWRERLFKDFIQLIERTITPIEFAGIYAKTNLEIILNYLQLWLVDMLKIKNQLNREFITNIDQINILASLTEAMQQKKLFHCIDKITKTNKYIIHNLNSQLALEDVAIELTK